ncbi:VOC family protein [Natrinema salinisoli]|uniref:VOC family protein n=1 Tax=Natrinema salinisoli TaxID=2878535 RepID=UPI001CF0145B|nr:VOC family protein [Natrinema salinisoli]
MAATGFNHVTVYGDDVTELVDFYTRVFDLERVQAPNLGVPAAWLRCGDGQLHIVRRDTDAPRYHHFALTVDDFEAVYRLARADDLFDEHLAPDDGLPIFELPDGSVQMYLRDPAGNLIEVDWPTAATLDNAVTDQIVDRSDEHPQSEAQAQAELFVDS